MKVQDLGELDGPIMVFGGPYSNLQAVQAVAVRAWELGIPAGHIICTGDVVAYCGQPVETIAAIREMGCAVLKGNCEARLAAKAPDCGCGFDDGTTCALLSRDWYSFAASRISARDRAWMETCPDRIVFAHRGRRFAVIHGGATDVSAFIWPVTPESEFQRQIAQLCEQVGPVDSVIAGHCGIAFHRKIGSTDWINAGVIGMPQNDGQTRTVYTLIDDGTATAHRLEYDHQAASRAMVAAGLTQGYDQALLSGYWPSEDVLPPGLRRAA